MNALQVYAWQIKNTIFNNLARDPHESPLKVVLATIALGMGADLRHVSQVIHIGPPKNMEGKWLVVTQKIYLICRLVWHVVYVIQISQYLAFICN